MAKIEKSVELEVPVSTAYNQMTQFEAYPGFMSGVSEVKQIDDTHLHWRGEINGQQKEWDAEIVEQVPDECIVWACSASDTQSPSRGEVRFTPLGDKRCRLTLTMDADDQQSSEQLGQRAEADLQMFKQLIESQGSETGAWRGEVHGGKVAGKKGAGATPADAARSAMEQGTRFGRQAMEAATENAGRVSQQVTDLATHAFKTQQAIQSSAMDAANAALLPFRAGLNLDPQPWLNAMLNAFDEPFSVMRRFSEQMHSELEDLLSRNRDLLGREFGATGPTFTPSVDIARQDGHLLVQADLPGMRKEDITLEIDQGRLLLHGERRARHESVETGQKRVECSYGSFTRVIPLPDEVDPEKAEASMADGVLQITLPVMSSRQRGHRIEIRGQNEERESRQTNPQKQRAA